MKPPLPDNVVEVNRAINHQMSVTITSLEMNAKIKTRLIV